MTKCKTKALSGLLAVTLASTSAGACGGSGHTVPPARQTNPNTKVASSTTGSGVTQTTSNSYLHNDGDQDDKDVSDHQENAENDNSKFLASYGKEAPAAEKHSISTLVKSYYTAAVTENGARACGLLYPELAAGLTEGERSHPDDNDQACAHFASRVFKTIHQQLIRDQVATLVVTAVHTKGDFGLAVVGFKDAPEREVQLERANHAWKVSALLDGEVQ